MMSYMSKDILKAEPISASSLETIPTTKALDTIVEATRKIISLSDNLMIRGYP
ncbi:MAG: hypothetical protein Q8884_02680 [Sweet potato little leaf phytoplasma]|nr:hypothetical protein [Sweet potato little leaf phytoplasma]